MEIEILTSIREVAPEAWDRLCPPDDPFSEHAFLDALEASGSASPESGWSPCHLLLREGGALVGAMPLYLKDNSYGEYIFDWAGPRPRCGRGSGIILNWYLRYLLLPRAAGACCSAAPPRPRTRACAPCWRGRTP